MSFQGSLRCSIRKLFNFDTLLLGSFSLPLLASRLAGPLSGKEKNNHLCDLAPSP